MGYQLFQSFQGGCSYELGDTYIVLEQSPALSPGPHDRMRPGLNHLAFHIEGTDAVESIAAQAVEHGWKLMFADKHPFAGGESHYAAYLENEDGFEVELVATSGNSSTDPG
jgi:catechol-2,3-dioxygenase